MRPGKVLPLPIIEAYPEYLYLVTDTPLSRWREAEAVARPGISAQDSGVATAYRRYRESLQDVPEVETLFSLGRTHAYYSRLTVEEVSVLLAATTRLGEDLAALGLT